LRTEPLQVGNCRWQLIIKFWLISTCYGTRVVEKITRVHTDTPVLFSNSIATIIVVWNHMNLWGHYFRFDLSLGPDPLWIRVETKIFSKIRAKNFAKILVSAKIFAKISLFSLKFSQKSRLFFAKFFVFAKIFRFSENFRKKNKILRKFFVYFSRKKSINGQSKFPICNCKKKFSARENMVRFLYIPVSVDLMLGLIKVSIRIWI
jgi:hypothetical protein